MQRLMTILVCLSISNFVTKCQGDERDEEQVFNVTICTKLVMPPTQLCTEAHTSINISEAYLYDFNGDEYDGRPCDYNSDDCEMPVTGRLREAIFSHCVGRTLCGGFRINSFTVCGGRYSDYLIIHYRCLWNESLVDTTTQTTPATLSGHVTSADIPTTVTPGSSSLLRAEQARIIGLCVGVLMSALAVVIFIVVVILLWRKRNARKMAAPYAEHTGFNNEEISTNSQRENGISSVPRQAYSHHTL